MKMKTRIIIIVCMVIFFLYYFISTIITGFSISANHKPEYFNYVKKSIDLNKKDSALIDDNLFSSISNMYTSSFSDSLYLSYIKFDDKSGIIIRKLKSHEDLSKVHIEMNGKKTDLMITYDLEEIAPFNYMIDIKRKFPSIRRLYLEGDEMKILKRSKDTILITGKLINLAVASKNLQVHDGIYLQDETVFKSPIFTKILFVNQKESLYLYLCFANKQKSLSSSQFSKLLKN
jgi:hypothetical protein